MPSPLKTTKAIRNISYLSGFDSKGDHDEIVYSRDLPDDVNSSIKVS